MEVLNISLDFDAPLFDVQISESEAYFMYKSMIYTLQHLNDEEMNNLFTPKRLRSLGDVSDSREFLEGTIQELMLMMKDNMRDYSLNDEE